MESTSDMRVVDSGSIHGDVNETDLYFTNAIDSVFKELLPIARPELVFRELEDEYCAIWKEQYVAVLERQSAKCQTAVDRANAQAFSDHTETALSVLQPFIINCAFDNFSQPESPEKNSWGIGTRSWLNMYQGMIYRDACIFLLSNGTSGYSFPSETEVRARVEALLPQ